MGEKYFFAVFVLISHCWSATLLQGRRTLDQSIGGLGGVYGGSSVMGSAANDSVFWSCILGR